MWADALEDAVQVIEHANVIFNSGRTNQFGDLGTKSDKMPLAFVQSSRKSQGLGLRYY